MGCTPSRFEREKSVTNRCRNRELLIKQCVQKQHAFAAAHAAYIRSLRDTGAALRQFGEGGDAKPDIVHGHGMDFSSNTADDSKQLAHTFGTPYFPPPLPHFLTPSFLSRTCSIPQFNFSSPHALSVAKSLIFSSPRNSFSYTAEESAETDAGAVRKSYYVKPPPPLPAQLATPPAPPSKGSQWEFYNVFQLADHKSSAFPLEEEPGLEVGEENANANVEELKTPSKSQKNSEPMHPASESDEVVSAQRPYAQASVVEFVCTLKELDDNFLQAYDSGRDVARLLEGQRTHYYSSLGSYNGSCEHSSRVLRVMSWGRHVQFASTTSEATTKLDGEEKETHAATLDKLLAWEKKLYDEVKVGEVIRIKLERKSVQLKKQKKREESSVALNKTKAVVKDLQTRYLVEVQAVDAASSEVQKLRDDCLHFQLVDLVQKSMSMWQAMLNCHQQQYQLIEDMKLVDSACAPTSTNDSQIKNTLQLESEIHNWHDNLDSLIATQKDYMNSVHLWLRLHITEIESGGKGVPSSPKKLNTPPVYSLCKSWISALDQVHGNVPLNTLKAFSGVIQELKTQQAAELKLKKKLDQLKKELERKEQAFRSQELKYKKFHMAHGGSNGKEELTPKREMDRSPLKEKEVSLRLLRERMECECEKYEQMCTKSGNMALNSLQKGLPPVLSAMRDFARTCFQTYTELFMLTIAEETPVLQISY